MSDLQDWLDNMSADTKALNAEHLPQKPKQKRKQTERDIQAQVCEFAKWQSLVEGFQELDLLFAIPNGQVRPGVAREPGIKAGVPDLFLPVARGGYHGLFVEMKALKGRVRPEQVKWHKLLEAQGYCVRVCKGYNAAVITLGRYMQNDITRLLAHKEDTTQ